MATSKLQRLFGNMLDRRLPEYRIRENYRPNWLISSDNTWLELDFFIEELKIAFEVQGEQHYKFVPFFHKTEDDFKKRRKHDHEKRELCYGRGVKLIEILTVTDAEIAIKNIEESTKKNNPKYLYQEQEISNTKFKKLFKMTDPSLAEKRIKRCQRNIYLWERGELQASLEKVNEWKKVVSGH